MSGYPYFCTECNEERARLTEHGRCTMCHGARIVTYTHEVAVVEHETERTIKAVKVQSLHRAKKVQSGMEINLDHRFYYTELRNITP